ncbi:nuclease domain-containing protein [Vibrio splendidus]
MKIEWMLESNSSKVKYNHDLMCDSDIFIPDDIEYTFRVNIIVDDSIIDSKPELFLGDVEIKLFSTSPSNGMASFTSRAHSGFFDNAHFFNYFGESEVVLVIHANGEKQEHTKLINVTLKPEKATIANDMLIYLSDNMEDISQVCFSKTRSGFMPKSDGESCMVKFENLNKTISFLESHAGEFSRKKKDKIVKNVEMQSDVPPIYDHNTTEWLTENLDKLEPARKQEHTLVINKKYYNVELPRNNYFKCTNQKENQAIHWFLLSGIQYCDEMIKAVRSQESSRIVSYENSEYIRFDQVIKNVINPILKRKVVKLKDTRNKLINLKMMYNGIIPVKKLKPTLPSQTSFTLKNSHYCSTFNLIKNFYDANHVDRSEELYILMGMRNLSQIYEFCCLYKIINGIKEYCYVDGGLVSTRLIVHDKTWEGIQTMSVNILANQFIFKIDDNRFLTLYYEKPFYPIVQNKIPDNTIIRISKSTQPYRPDYTLRLDDSITGEHRYIILDAKFKNEKNVKRVYSEMHSKYAQELKSVKNRSIDNSAIKYVGLLYGISSNDKILEDSFISEVHGPNGLLPITPYFSSMYLGANSNETISEILKQYLL